MHLCGNWHKRNLNLKYENNRFLQFNGNISGVNLSNDLREKKTIWYVAIQTFWDKQMDLMRPTFESV